MDESNGFDEIVVFRILEQVAAGACAQDLAYVNRIAVHAESEDFCCGEFIANLTSAFDAVEFGHGDVHDDNVGAEFADFFDRFAPGSGFADDFHIELRVN